MNEQAECNAPPLNGWDCQMGGRRKNLIYVFADQWRYHALGCSGEDDVCTPEMDAFAGESMVFDNAVSTYPLCSPHRAALLTGKNPLSCHMWTNCKIGLKDILMLAPQETLISDVLHEEGYCNAYIGKWHLDASELNFSDSPQSGAVNWDAYTPPGERRHHFDFWYSYGANDEHLSPHYWTDSPEMIHSDRWSPEHETDVLISFLDGRDQNRPFSAFLSWNPPHPPYDLVPEKYLSPWRNKELHFRENVPSEMRTDSGYQESFRQYYAAIEGLDHEFGRLIAYLKDNGLYEDTVIVLSADHGDAMGSHGLYGKNIWYEESIRIPLIIHASGLGCGKKHSFVTSADQMPTLLDLLDIRIPETVQGRSSFSSPERSEAFFCMIPGMPDLVRQYEDRGLDNRAFGWRAVRDRRYKYVIDSGTSPGCTCRRLLYDLEMDPYELDPLEVEPDSELARRYDARIAAYSEEHNDRFLMR